MGNPSLQLSPRDSAAGREGRSALGRSVALRKSSRRAARSFGQSRFASPTFNRTQGGVKGWQRTGYEGRTKVDRLWGDAHFFSPAAGPEKSALKAGMAAGIWGGRRV